ncbi:4'-phosphopantetheinyl transferase family protein [Paractinoplanes toevensis]|uniref:4'-phosphopantetheinyl transferase n=1 Tax=Paractinoplanes toevensis TaxID=571911 RepID=A0A919W263_9ACTN|nr:4'-phosphopantetheinyl transferase superfamily protein [Actinoplanes toevensis]GIM89180.1 4'-phosphopantetheinyl transferase [Actinoplanes toevensis]
MIGDLLPPGVAWAERFDDEVPGALYPVEEQVVAKAVPKRRREFATGRWCARQALHQLGVPPAPILPAERGAPGWPPGIAGSITHCDGYRAAVVTRLDAYASVGVDAEPDEPLPPGVLEAISLPEERAQLTGRPGRDRLLFCAKESIYKAWFPLARRWLDFTEARVELREGGTFSAEILVDGPVSGFEGRWLTGSGLLLAAVTVPR